MAEIKVDTQKMRDTGTEIMEISIQLNQEFQTLYDRLANMPYQTKEWTGLAAVEFAKAAKGEKCQCFQLKESIYKLGKHLVDEAEFLEKEIDLLRRES